MPVSSGTRLGPYLIEAPLGAGGMGEVYRAKDTRLARDVAIKVLPAHVAADADRQSRFEREARAIARLNHPNLLGLYDVGDQDGLRYIVTELVDGEPVRGPMPPRRLVEVGAQIAEGLAAAHAAGIVHRDLKPDNILVGRDGRVKILDFGLASDLPDGPEGAGLTRAATSPGTVLGTVAYMSPEQARGVPADARSDQFSLGLVLYELACGRQAFVRDSAVQTLSAIIEAEPDLSPLATLPAPLRWVIERCLSKRPEDRYGSTLDLARDLRQLRDRHSELSQSGVTERRPPAPGSRRWPLAASGIVLVALVAAAARWTAPGAGLTLDAYHLVPFAVEPGVQTMPAWSPDGERLAYSREVDGYFQIFARQLSQSTPVQLTSLEADCLFPAWDPTGARVFFQRGHGIASDKNADEIWVVSGAGGAPERVSESARGFTVAPDGTSIVYLKSDAGGTVSLWSRDLKTGASRQVLAPTDIYRDAPRSGSLHFSRDGSLLAMTSAADDELLVYRNPLTSPAAAPRRIRFSPAAGGRIFMSDFDWLPDGHHVILDLRDSRGGDKSLWVGDVDRGTVARLTASVQWEATPAASPDGARIAFSATPLNWDIVGVDLPAGQPRPLVASSRYDGWGDWLPDGSGLIYSTQRTGHFEIWTENLRDHTRRAIITPDAFAGGPSFFLVQGTVSPDGRSIAYVRFGGNEERIFVSAIGGSRPVQLTAEKQPRREDGPAWSRDGRWIAFRSDRRLMKALAGGETAGTLLANDVDTDAEGGAVHWMPDGLSLVYRAGDGLKQVPADGGPARLVTREPLVLWDLSPDGRLVYAMVERAGRSIDLVTIDVATGLARTLTSLGRRPVSPDYTGYSDTLRAMRVAPDGTRLMYAFLNPTADIWILEGFNRPGRSWWPLAK